MPEEKKDAKVKKVEPKVRIVTLGDYITKIGNDLAGQDKTKAALVLLYSENTVINVLDNRKGITYFIVEK